MRGQATSFRWILVCHRTGSTRWWGLSRSTREVRNSGAAWASTSSYANTGVHLGDVHLAPQPIARSAYRQQIRRIAPELLEGRQAELVELSEFCTRAEGPSWAWWQAPAWSGKSALMASFVLNPPDGVQIVSFFVTARWAGQSDRTAFADIVLEQLAELAGLPLPGFLTDATRGPQLLSMLENAARVCIERGERLVLLIDGLDEDRGVRAGPNTHSIAAMLPERLPNGMRVIVAGRPHPPVPADVPDHHPLRDPRIVRPLSASERAKVVRADAERELKSLLYGDPEEQELLGLVVAAGGGLSSRDFAELIGGPEWKIGDHLWASPGRTFSERTSHWKPNDRPVVYVLAHEELQQFAAGKIGTVRLAELRDRLHAWADDYMRRRWPESTPEYLLRGYYRLLVEQGDINRMTACATDAARSDRMLDLSGGDTAALNEISSAQEVVCADRNPDLGTMLALAAARDRLKQRNSLIPIGLPAVWAALGSPDRAESLAGSIADPERTIFALIGLIRPMANDGESSRALQIAGRVGRAVGVIRAPIRRGKAVKELAEAVVHIGEIDHAAAIARSITKNNRRALVCSALAVAAARADLYPPNRIAALIDSGERLSGFIGEPVANATTLAELAAAAALTGDLSRAQRIIDFGTREALAIENTAIRVDALSRLIGATAEFDDDSAVSTLAELATDHARGILDPYRKALSLLAVADAIAAHDVDRARQLVNRVDVIAYSMDSDLRLAEVRCRQACTSAKYWDFVQAESSASLIRNPERQARARSKILEYAAMAGELRRADCLADAMPDPRWRSRALTTLAWVSASTDRDRAHSLAAEAENVARSAARPDIRLRSRFVGAMLAAGDIDRAETIARSIDGPGYRAIAFGELAVGLANAGARDRAGRLASSAEEVMRRGFIAPGDELTVLALLARAAAMMGEVARVHALAMRAERAAAKTSNGSRVGAMCQFIRVMGRLGEAERARHLVERTEQMIRSARKKYRQSSLMRELAEAAAESGQLDRAHVIANNIGHADQRAMALCALSTVIATTGIGDEAWKPAARAASTLGRISHGYTSAIVLAELSTAWRAIGDHARAHTCAEQAEAIADKIPDGDRKADVLARIAQNAEPEEARRLLAVALANTAWANVLQQVAECEPNVVAEIEDLDEMIG